MVSALSGLREVIIDTQTVLLNAAILAGVPRFIPLELSLDFTKTKNGRNRNLDLRREFHLTLDQASISATSVFNGGFGDMLTDEIPMKGFFGRMVLCFNLFNFGNPANRN